MKRFHAMVYDNAHLKADTKYIPIRTYSYDTLFDAIWPSNRNPEFNRALRIIVYETRDDGSIHPIRYGKGCWRASDGRLEPDFGFWREIGDHENRGLLYGQNLTDEQNALIAAKEDTAKAYFDKLLGRKT